MTSETTRFAQNYWDIAADHYDQAFPDTLIGRAQRKTVWEELDRVFGAGQQILELNCGTGIDALHLAERGVNVFACDISPRMVELASRRSNSSEYGHLTKFRILATEDICRLADDDQFDGVFSNFSGLNCVEDLAPVARNLSRLVKPGAKVLLCMMGRFCLLETAWYLVHGEPRKALRRLRQGSVGRHNDNAKVSVHHWTVNTVARAFAPDFRLQRRRGIGVTLPPSCSADWIRRFPRVFDGLARTDRWLGCVPALWRVGDCVLLLFERVGD